MHKQMIEVGRVKALSRYPVKSMRGELLEKAYLYWHGLDGDRRYAFVRGDVDSSFPWLTGRQVADMLRYIPQFSDPADVVNASLTVQTPNGRLLPIASPDLLAELTEAYGGTVHLINIGRGAFDSLPLSVMSMATAAAVGADARRFRQNILIETASGKPFAEEAWIGSALLIGDKARIRLNRRIQRCSMVNLDPDTAVSDPSILKTVAQTRDNCLGVHASTEVPGSIAVGDTLRLITSV